MKRLISEVIFGPGLVEYVLTESKIECTKVDKPKKDNWNWVHLNNPGQYIFVAKPFQPESVAVFRIDDI